LSAVHSLLVYKSLYGVYSDTYHWSVADLGSAVDQLQAVGCDQSVEDMTQILTHVYTAKCHNELDAELIRSFIVRLVQASATHVDVIVEFTVDYITLNSLTCDPIVLWQFFCIMFLLKLFS